MIRRLIPPPSLASLLYFPLFRSFISMLCRAHPMLLCMQWRFRTRPQISRAASPTGLQREEEYTYRETSLSVIWLGTFFPELCVRKVEVIFFPHACNSGREEKENMIWTWLMLPGHLSAERLVAFGVRCEYFRAVPLRGSSFTPLKENGQTERSWDSEKRARLFIFHKYDESTHAVQPNLVSRTSELQYVHSQLAHFFFIIQLPPAGTWAPNG